MYIAVICDNMADRKQLERLLGRANDALSDETGTLYIDAFGDEKSFLSTAMRYELFFIDLTLSEDGGRSVIEALKEAGVPGRIAVCKSEDSPFSYQDAIEGIFSIDKPILTAPLHAMIKEAHAEFIKSADQTPKLEIRNETETNYIPFSEIVCAIAADHTVEVHLENGEVVSYLGDILSFDKNFAEHGEFFYATNDTIVNSNHVLSRTKKEIVLTDKTVIRLKRFPFFK